MSNEKEKQSFSDFLASRKHTVKSARETTYAKFQNLPIKEIKKNKVVTYTTAKEFDFLKFFMIVEYYYLNIVFPELTRRELHLLFFLYSEPPFTRKDYNDFEETLYWDKNRLNRFIEQGHIVVYKPEKKGKRKNSFHTTKLYTLSARTKSQVRAFHDKLMLRYKITETPQHNPMFRTRARTYVNKVFAKKVVQMNEYTDKVRGKDKYPKTEDDMKDLNKVNFYKEGAEYGKTNNETLMMPHDVKMSLECQTNECKKYREKQKTKRNNLKIKKD